MDLQSRCPNWTRISGGKTMHTSCTWILDLSIVCITMGICGWRLLTNNINNDLHNYCRHQQDFAQTVCSKNDINTITFFQNDVNTNTSFYESRQVLAGILTRSVPVSVNTHSMLTMGKSPPALVSSPLLKSTKPRVIFSLGTPFTNTSMDRPLCLTPRVRDPDTGMYLSNSPT